MYSFQEHQRLAETKYLYGATVIIGMCQCHSKMHTLISLADLPAEGIMALVDPALRALYDLKVRPV